MKIALISDIHGNTPALEAVFADIKDNNIDEIYCLGDLLGKGPRPEQAINMIKNTCTQSLMGNWDDFFLYSSVSEMPIDWYREKISSESAEYLKTLPYTIQLNFEGILINLFHAHPQNVYKRIFSKDTLNKKLTLFDDPSSKEFGGICIYGDIHYQFIEQLDNQHIIANTGSVGNPLDNNMAKYIVLEGIKTKNCQRQSMALNKLSENEYTIQGTTGKITLTFKEINYDREKAIRHTNESTMPEKELFIKEIEMGMSRFFLKTKE